MTEEYIQGAEIERDQTALNEIEKQFNAEGKAAEVDAFVRSGIEAEHDKNVKIRDVPLSTQYVEDAIDELLEAIERREDGGVLLALADDVKFHRMIRDTKGSI